MNPYNKGTMNFKDFESPVEFKLEGAFSWGVRRSMFCGYDILIIPSEEDATKISYLAKVCGARNPIRCRTMNLKTETLSNKQRRELLDKGRTNILVHFRVIGVCTRGATNHHLIFKVTKLRKLTGSLETREEAPED